MSSPLIQACRTAVPLPNSTCGAKMYAQGLGTWRGKVGGELYNAVLQAIKAGYRLIDCATVYRNQEEIGRAIHDAVSSGLVKREELYIVSKVWNTDHAPEDVAASTATTIKHLQCSYLDLLLMHWPIAWKHTGRDADDLSDAAMLPVKDGGSAMHTADVPVIDTWRAMEKLVEEKKVRDIGVSNFTVAELKDLLSKAKIKPVAQQIEMHPALPQVTMREFCRSQGIVVMAFKPLGAAMAPNSPSLAENEKIQKIAKDCGAPTPQHLLLQWVSQCGAVCLCKSTNPNRIAANASVLCGGLPEDTMRQLGEFHKTVDPKERRGTNPSNFRGTPQIFFDINEDSP